MSKPTSSTTTIPSGHPNFASNTIIQTSRMAIAAMVCGIISLLFFGIVLGPIAILLGYMAQKQIDDKPEEFQGKCQAKTGIICGSLATLIWIIVVIVWALE